MKKTKFDRKIEEYIKKEFPEGYKDGLQREKLKKVYLTGYYDVQKYCYKQLTGENYEQGK